MFELATNCMEALAVAGLKIDPIQLTSALETPQPSTILKINSQSLLGKPSSSTLRVFKYNPQAFEESNTTAITNSMLMF
jgi:hypothetical protein